MMDMKTVNNNINLKFPMKTIHLDGRTKKIRNNRITGIIIIKDTNNNKQDLLEFKVILEIMITKGMILRILDMKNAKDNIQIKLMKGIFKNGIINS